MRQNFLVTAVFLAIPCFVHAQAPAGCDAPLVQQQLKESFYTEMLSRGRAARAERMADPYAGSSESFSAGIEKASAKLQAEIKVKDVIDQGYKDQIKARFCAATLVVADYKDYAVPTRYFVQRTTDGMVKLATEFQLPGGGGRASFNVLIAFFDRLFAVAFPSPVSAPRPQPVAQAEPAVEEEQESPGDMARGELAAADNKLNDAYKVAMAALNADGKTKLRTSQRAWIKRRDKDCAPDPEAGTTDWSPGVLDALACLIKFTENRTAELVKIGGEK